MKELRVPLLALPLLSVPVLATEPPALPLGPATSVDAPAPYRYLDWVSKDEIDSLPDAHRPKYTGVCPGYYLPPVVTPREPVEDDTQAPVEASAEHYEMVGEHLVHMHGGVVVQQGHRLLESDQLDLDTQTKKAELEKNVRVRQQGMLLTGEKANLDLNSKQLSVTEAEYVIHANHVRGTATRLHNTRKNVLVLDRSTYTTCEPGSNTWYFQADDLRLNAATGWGTARNMIVRIKDFPVFYTPWLMFPIDERRQSGFLFPQIGHNSTGGLDIGIPYYLNLAPNYDATITPRYLGRHGILLDSEFRYLTPYSKGELAGGYMDQDENYGDEKRYLLLWNHASAWKNGWSASTNYGRVSDQDYFIDIDTDLNASAQTQLSQMAQTNYRTDHWDFLALVQRYQTISKLLPEVAEPYRKLPQLRADGRGPLAAEGWSWLLGSELVQFEHPYDDLTIPAKAERVNLSPGVSYRTETAWGYVNPSVQTVRTQYHLTDGTATVDANPDITTYLASVDSGLFFERDVSVFGVEQKQTLEPRAYFLYVPKEESQNDIPLFDTAAFTFSYDQLFRNNRFTGGDRYGDDQKVSLGVTSRFISEVSGEEWLRMSIGQAYHLKDRYVQLYATTPPQEAETSAIAGRIVWQLAKQWFFYQDAEWNAESNNIDNINTGFQLNEGNEYLLNFNYLYHDPDVPAALANPFDEKIKQTDLSFISPLSTRWSLLGRWGYDVELHRSFDNMVGVEYDSCCWTFRIVSRRFLQESLIDPVEVEPKSGVYFQFELKGLYGLNKKKIDGLFEDSISGYEDRQLQRRFRY